MKSKYKNIHHKKNKLLQNRARVIKNAKKVPRKLNNKEAKEPFNINNQHQKHKLQTQFTKLNKVSHF